MKVNTVGKKIFKAEFAYLAGFIDADGAVMASIEKHNEKKFNYRVRVIIKVTQGNRDILDIFQQMTKMGNVRGNRTTYDWIVRDRKEIKTLLKLIMPFLKVKKKQAKIASKIINCEIRVFKDLKNIAFLADSLSSLNVRSKNRRKNFASMIQKKFSSND